MKKSWIPVILVLLFSLVGCVGSEEIEKNQENLKFNIYTTVYPLEYMINEFVGDTVDVHSVYPMNADIHDYEITSPQMKDILNSDLFFYINDNMESYIPEIKEAIKKGESDTKLVATSEQKQLKKVLTRSIDEHYWLSPQKTLILAEVVYQKLQQNNLINKELYTENYNDFIMKVKKLDEKYQKFAKEQKKTVIVAHDAYFWLREDYGIDIIGMYGPDHHDEPSAFEIQKAIDLIQGQNVGMIFVEQNDKSNAVIKQISEETNVEIGILNNLSTKESIEEDYLLELNKNIVAMKKVNN